MHPPFGLNLERIVPPTGATICNRFVPGGTIVGCSSVIIQRDKVTFGGDVDTYRPERWIENGGNGEKLRGMERAMFLFGAGNHVCLGKNIAAMEIYKLVPSLMRAFEVRIFFLEDFNVLSSLENWSLQSYGIID